MRHHEHSGTFLSVVKFLCYPKHESEEIDNLNFYTIGIYAREWLEHSFRYVSKSSTKSITSLSNLNTNI